MLNDFFSLVFNNVPSYLLTVSVCMLVYGILLRKHIYSIFDPFLLAMFLSSLGCSAVFFMFFNNMIKEYYFYSYILTQIAFILGLIIVKPINLKNLNKFSKINIYKESIFNRNLITIIYYLASISFLVAQIYSYKLVGIPLLRESRLGLYSEGTGIVKRFLDVCGPVTIFILVHRYLTLNRNKRFFCSWLYDFALLSFILISLALSGSKSAFLSSVYIIFFYFFFSYRLGLGEYFYNRLRKIGFALVSLAFIVAITVTIIQSHDKTVSSGLMRIVYRFISAGDIFIYAYQDNVLQQIDKDSGILAIVMDFLGLFRIIPWAALPKALGLQIYQTIYNVDTILGPNPRHNVFGLFYFGFFGAILYSFTIGFLVSFVRNKFYFLVPKDLIGGILYMFAVKSVICFSADITSGLSYFNSFVLIFLPLFFTSYIIAGAVTSPVGKKNAKIDLCYNSVL